MIAQSLGRSRLDWRLGGKAMDERLQRAAVAVREAGADWGVLTSVDAVAYAAGHAPVIEAGPSPFAGGPTLALVGADGGVGLVAPNVEAGAAVGARVDERALYEGFAFQHPAPLHANYLAAVRGLASRLRLHGT